MKTETKTQTKSGAPNYGQCWTLKDCRSLQPRKRLQPHQEAALGKLNDWFASSPGRESGGVLVLPTGAGKTFTAAYFLCAGPLSDGYKVLWLAHTHHLLVQAFKEFDPQDVLCHIREPRSTLQLRVVSGDPGHYPPADIRPTDDIVIATLQTIVNARRETEPLRQLEEFIASAGKKLFVVFDEAHHSPAPSFRKLLLGLRQLGAPVLGLTATPTYTDESRRGWLAKLFPQGILYQARATDLMAQGILARPRFERPKTAYVPKFDEKDYQQWLGTYRDIPENVIEELARDRERNALIAKTYADNRKDYRKTIIFADRWFQCDAIVEALRTHNVKAGAVYSHQDASPGTVAGRQARTRDENTKVLDDYRADKLDVVVNVRMLTEGTDIPKTRTVFLTRQTTSKILLTQMVGRALRGPKFGGNPDAYIVSFVDDWQHAIQWAEFDPLGDGQAVDGSGPTPSRPPQELISIDLVRRLARQMQGGMNVCPGPFISLVPAGWYRVVFDVSLPTSDEVESREQLVMVFDDERAGLQRFVDSLLSDPPTELAGDRATLDECKELLEGWAGKYLPTAHRAPPDLYRDLFHLARHIAQGNGVPRFFPFEIRQAHDLDAVAQGFIDRDLGPKAIQDLLRSEYERRDRFWSSLLPRFETFRDYYSACANRLLDGGHSGGAGPKPHLLPEPTSRTSEPTEEIKASVRRRDRNRCLACNATKGLEADHILAVRKGGPPGPENLQTLCRVCNRVKGDTRRINFRTDKTPLASPPALAIFDRPTGTDAGDRSHWDRFLRRTLNFTFECAAVSDVKIGGRGDGYYNWVVDLMPGNSPKWIKPHLERLIDSIQTARLGAGKPEIRSFTIRSPGETDVSWSA